MGRGVKSENKKTIMAIGIALLIIVVGYAALIAYTGMNTPFSVVMSQSMQHDNERSQIGCIDTGDIVVVKNKSNSDIQSYVEGTQTGYSSFGDYGSVIIYERNVNYNPVIHRAIVWLEWDSNTKKWSSPELENYKGTWYSSNGSDYTNLTGTLTFVDITQSKKTVSINLSSLGKNSGYLTLGDNPKTNLSFDQASGIIGHPISYSEIKSVPILELPWLGTIKLLIKGNSNLTYVPNSVPSLAMLLTLVIASMVMIDIIWQARRWKNE
jgi:signal peptidase